MSMSEQAVRTVIPAAGLGTRLLPLTRAVPKELLPVGRFPMIHWCLAEAADAGAREVIIVIRKGKEAIRSYLECDPVRATSGDRSSQELERLLAELEIRYVYQETPRGPGDALLRASDAIGNSPFILMYPDDVFPAGGGPLRKLVELYRETGEMVTGLIHVDHARGHLFGNCGHVDLETTAEGVYRIRRLHDKNSGQFRARSNREIRWTGRHVLEPVFLDHLRKFDNGNPDEELDDVIAFQDLIHEHGMLGVPMEDDVYDVGNMPGYLAANACLASREAGLLMRNPL
jgi:UTP--glucose-1-phosphate uridylyltransferase